MKIKIKYSLLISMIGIGIICGISFYVLMVPLNNKSLLHCIIMGVMYGIINYIVSFRMYEKYSSLKKSNELLKQDLNIDKLTGLFNRRAFDSDISYLDTDLYSMIFIDIDNFRKFNNKYGHQAGDAVLKKVSNSIIESIGSKDKAYRYGGEEIVIILMECPKNTAFGFAEKIRNNVEKLDNYPYSKISISLGISAFPEDGNKANQIILACDEALIKAKNSGKNCTFMC